mgnify:CR=1 FL=1
MKPTEKQKQKFAKAAQALAANRKACAGNAEIESGDSVRKKAALRKLLATPLLLLKAKDPKTLSNVRAGSETKARLSLDSPAGGPALAELIASVLSLHGAKVSFRDRRCKLPNGPVKLDSLRGLHVHIERITWVRSEEAERW